MREDAITKYGNTRDGGPIPAIVSVWGYDGAMMGL